MRPHLLLPLLLALPSLPLAAQSTSGPIRSPTRVTTIIYRGSASSDGYPIARVPVRYAFAVCFDEIVIAYSAELDAASATSGYYFRGTFYTEDLSGAISDPPTAPFAATVYEGTSRFLVRVSDQQAIQGADFGCYGQTRTIGKVTALAGTGRTPDQLRNYVNSLYLSVEESPRPFRNTAYEGRLAAAIRDSTAQARRDSIAAVAAADSVARADSLAQVAVADSLARVARADSLDRAAGADTAQGDSVTARQVGTDTLGRAGKAAAGAGAAAAGGADPEEVRRREQQQAEFRRFQVQLGMEKMTEADQAYRSGNKQRAMELYGDIVTGKTGGFYTSEQLALAQQRRNEMMGDIAAETGAQGLTLLSQITGFDVGINWSDGYFAEDWSVGITGGRVVGPTLAYLDVGVGFEPLYDLYSGMSGDTLGTGEMDDDEEHLQWMWRVGGTIPGVALRTGGRTGFFPHLGFTQHHTNVRTLNLLHTGVLWQGGNGFLRLDITFINGESTFGLASGFNLR